MSSIDRRAGVTLGIMLVVGFAYSGAATVGQHRRWLSLPAAAGSNATIDGLVAVAGLSKAEDLRSAVRDAGWPIDEDVVIVGAASSLTTNELKQFHFSASYLLYPRRVWLTTWCDPAVALSECERRQAMADLLGPVLRYKTSHLVLVGGSNPFPGAEIHRVSELVSLVELQ